MITVLIDDLDKRVVANAEVGAAQQRTTNGFGRRMPNIKRWIRHGQQRGHASAKPQGVARRTGAILLATATALVGAVVAPAQEYDPPVTTLVQNTGQSSGRIVSLSAHQDGLYQGFRPLLQAMISAAQVKSPRRIASRRSRNGAAVR